MEVVGTRAGWRAACDAARAAHGSLGLVPTMGALHEGHRSLVETSVARCDATATTIFVNPLQFGDPTDLDRYPRTLEADLALLEEAGCDLVFTPEVHEIYPDFPEMPATTVHVEGAALGFEGAGRPGHFDGVATVVTLLFSLTGPSTAFFGEKDFQQLSVVRQMVADLGLPIEVVGCPTIREDDGLARSSRNVRLSPEARRAALVLSQALAVGRVLVEQGASPSEVDAAMAAHLATEPMATLSYASVVAPDDLSSPVVLEAGRAYRLLIAAHVGGVRLLDNLEAVAGTAS